MKDMFQKICRLFGIKRRQKGLVVTCSPNYNRESRVAQHPMFPYTWFYRTEVHNTTDVPLRIVWFDGFRYENWRWVPGNILGRSLDAQVFSAWYSNGQEIIDGVIPPGGVAVNACNWHASMTPFVARRKWAYRAVDPHGKEYYAEIVMESCLILNIQVG